MTDAELSNVEESEREGKHRKHKSAVVKGGMDWVSVLIILEIDVMIIDINFFVII